MKRTLALSLTMLLLLALLSGCGTAESAPALPSPSPTAEPAPSPEPEQAPESAATAQPEKTPEPEPTAQPEPAAAPEAAGNTDYIEVYKPILDSYYDMLSQPLDGQTLMDSGLCFLCMYCLDPLADTAYSYYDLDMDGTMELIIASVSEEEFLKNVVFDLYCISDGQPKLVFQSQERDRFFISYTGAVIRDWANSASDSGLSLWDYKAGELTEHGAVYDTVTYRDLGLTRLSEYAR